MWPGRAVSLIDRPWVPCPSASWQDLVSEGPPIAGEEGRKSGTERVDGSQNGICRYTGGSTGQESRRDVSKLVGTHYPR